MDDGNGRVKVEVFASFAALLAMEFRLMVIDIPIGILSGSPRAADGAAREFLRHRACCVFSAPYRPMLRARSHAEACAIREEIDGKRCSRQAFEIFGKIAEVDALMTPRLQEHIREGHPEVTFTIMRGGQPFDASKKTHRGHGERLEALRAYFPEVQACSTEHRPRGVGRDDILDAFAMLWTARRISAGAAYRLPRIDQCDDKGLRAEILA
jgi:predicted RNase H-like nuclease